VEQEQLRELHMVASADTLNLIQNAAIVDVDYQLLIDQIKVRLAGDTGRTSGHT